MPANKFDKSCFVVRQTVLSDDILRPEQPRCVESTGEAQRGFRLPDGKKPESCCFSPG